MALVEALGVDTVDMPHQPRQIRRPCVQHQVEVVAHQTVGQHLGIKTICCPGDDVQLGLPIRVVSVDRFAPVTPRGDVVDGIWEFDSQRAAHGLMLEGREGKGKT